MLRRRCRTTLAPLLQPPPSPHPPPYPWHLNRPPPPQRPRWRASSSSSSSSCNTTKTTEAATTTIPQRYAFLEQLPPQFLRRSHAGNVDPTTAQRTDVRYDPRTGKPTAGGGAEQRPRATQPPSRLAIAHIRPRVVPSPPTTMTTTNTRQPTNDTTSETTTTAITIVWNDGRETEHPNVAVLERHYHAWTRQGHQQNEHDPKNKQDQRKPWTHVTEAMVRRTTQPKNNNSSNSSNTTTATSSVALSMSFQDLMYDTNTNTNTNTSTGSGSDTGTGMQQALHVLYKYGILLVTDTPTEDEGAGIAALGGALGGGSIKTSRHTSLYTNYVMQQQNKTTKTTTTHDAEDEEEDRVLPQSLTDGPYRTLYGSVWSTSSSHQLEGTSIADSAYGTDGLPLHTDFTYVRDPPGLQVFTMRTPALVGGESVFADGLAIAEELRVVNPTAFHTLSTVSRTYQSLDHATGWSLHGSGPIIQLRDDDRWTIQGIRHNDLDRLPDLPPPPPPSGAVVPPTNTPNTTTTTTTTADDDFYRTLDEAHNAWDELLGQDKFRLVMKLMPGDTMVVANQRCLHGRYSFRSTTDSARTVMGCYVSQDELSSRFRMEGYEC